MPRRTKKKQSTGETLFGAAVLLIGFGLVTGAINWNTIVGFAAIAAALGFICLGLFAYVKEKRTHALADKLERAVTKHLSVLQKRRSQLLTMDAYGKAHTDKWEKELSHFIEHHVADGLSARELNELKRQKSEFVRYIEDRVLRETADNPVFQNFGDDMSPADFESFCAESLRHAGWSASTTPAGADQGVDILAEKNGKRVVLQCKLYGQTVGNKAVQEAVAARGYEAAHYAAVVSNQDYTRQARQLALTNSVYLLHYSDLTNMDSLIAESGKQSPTA